MTATGVYGSPPADLAEVAHDAIQFSPLMPGAASLDRLPEGSLEAMTLLAPPGTIERRYALALALRALKNSAPLTALAPNDRGGTRLRKELAAFGLDVQETSKRHHRIVTATKAAGIDGVIAQVIADGGPRFDDEIALWTQPGVFSWDRLDPGTHMLIEHLPALTGRGADFGCGIGILARAVLASDAVTELTLVDIDRRAIECAEHNLDTPRAKFLWADLRDPHPDLANLDFVVMNAPFHDAGQEDKGLAQAFVKRAHESLRKGGVCVMVANRHLPYEAVLKSLFKAVTPVIEDGGYKIYEARK
ncbi:class I SAM-dependent methyltransferase [Undibacter mobilis]|uniref:Class I SAM-dependent methyltransferase n=1 Tax=Undibacter mobilis TaxID=2292256 RepID=A0A371B145_9BRAD|nr:methyltransferase [Undibacter mobilis]RDV01306.1 class I SAM-dependent methyltransferase [Undibacter mobilis]